jgi:hypothetical protein
MKWYNKPILLGVSISGWVFIVGFLAAYVYIHRSIALSTWGF